MSLMFIIVALVALLVVAQANSYDWVIGNTSVSLAAAAYCDDSVYLTRTYKGAAAGFIPKFSIVEKSYDTQGFAGIMPSQNAIYVVFRGSTSIKDWVDNLDAILTDYPLCSKCEVHKGFYKTEKAFFPMVLSSVKTLRQEYPNYQLIVAGHSLGAAMATLTTLDLMANGISNIKMFHFGSPRVGNTNFANWASNQIANRNRNTHHKDMVPHVPMHERFTHISGEWYEDDSGLHECVGLEDPNCSYQWHITSIDDHMWYLGQYLGCDAVSRQ